MTIQLASNGAIELVGTCLAEDAEVLLQHLLANPGSVVAWHACDGAHAAVVQVLLAAGVIPQGTPANFFLREIVKPAFSESG